jgi:hypothetical protein
LALINAGSFRIDSTIGAELTEQDLRETFIYDRDDAIVIVRLTAAEIQKFCAHAIAKAGQGAFLQISMRHQEVAALVGDVRVAIVKYLLVEPEDQYQQILMQTRRCNGDEVLQVIGGPSPVKSSIIELVKQGAHQVQYSADWRLSGGSTAPSSERDKFIALVDDYIRACCTHGVQYPATVAYLDPLAARPKAPPPISDARIPLRNYVVSLIELHLTGDIDTVISSFFSELAESKSGYEKDIPYEDYFDAAVRYDWASRHVRTAFD